MKYITRLELREGMSCITFRTLPEIVPRLSDIPFAQLSPTEQEVYRHAYHTLGRLIRLRVVESSFKPIFEKCTDQESSQLNRPTFRLTRIRGRGCRMWDRMIRGLYGLYETEPFPRGQPASL
jgi:hypothetical protein